jgi:hypothetical protein
MKHSFQKSENLCLVPPDAHAHYSESEDKPTILRDTFDSWVDSVVPTLVQSTSPPEDQPIVADRGQRRSLSLNDVMRVNFATVREGTDHRHWPPEVVLSFIAADVIKRR